MAYSNTIAPPTATPTPTPSAVPPPSAPPAPASNQGRTAVTLGNGQQVYYDKTGQAFDGSGTAVSNATISTSTIGNPVTPPAQSGAPTPVVAAAPTLAEQFHTSLSSTLDSQQKALEVSYKQQEQSYTQQKDALTKQNSDYQQLEMTGLVQEGSAMQKASADKAAALDQYQQEYKTNFDARQKLTDTLKTLLDTGQSIIANLKSTSGLSSIMNAKISQTMADVQGQAGVISTALAAYDSQIGLATTHLNTTVAAISSIYNDQKAYWENVVSFYKGQETANNAKLVSLSTDEQKYVDAQIKLQETNIANTQATAKLIQAAMLDPKTALTYAKAGVSLTDSPAQVAQKLALQEQADQNVWGDPQKLGGDYIQRNKLTGETRTVVANISTPTTTPTTPVHLTSTQLNQGAANAALDTASFKALDPVVQNFYVNSKPLVTQFNAALSAISTGAATSDAVSANIDKMTIPESVKTYLKSKLPTGTPKSAGGIWSSIRGYLGL